MATGFGLRLIGRAGGGSPRCREYYVPAGDSTALLQGDVVKLTASAGTLDPLNEVQGITRAATGDKLLGVVLGFRPDPSLPYTGQIRAASTARYVTVCDDPDAIYEVQEDAVGGAVTAAQVGAMFNANIIVASGSTVTGLSGTMLDSSTATQSAADLKIVGVRRDLSNAAAQTAGAILHAMILAPAIKATASEA